MRASPLILIAVLKSAAFAAEPDPKAAATGKAQAAVTTLKKSLKEALVAALKTSPEAAIEVCAAQAPALAARASTGGVLVGRTGFKLRNPDNAPRPWVADAMKTLAAKPKDGEHLVVELGKDKLGYVETIVTQPMCLTCHGPAVAEPVGKALRARYPKDQALGFKEGEFRGVFWAEVAR